MVLLTSSLVFAVAQVNAVNGQNDDTDATESFAQNMLRFEWPQVCGGSATARFSAGPAPETADILWKANVTNIQSFVSAFNGMVFVCSNSSVIALDRETGNRVWATEVDIRGTWPMVYKIDGNHMVVEGTCLDPRTGDVLWTSESFCTDTGLYNDNVYSPEEKMFYVKNLSYVEAWNFSDPSQPPTLEWETYVPGGGRVGSGLTYGDGKVFPGSFQAVQMALDAKTGDVVWSTLTKSPMIFQGAYSDGLFVRGGTDDNTMYCFNATDGETLWTYSPGTDGYFTVGCAVAYGMVFEPNKDGSIYAVNITTGELVWKYQGPGTMLFPGMPTVADGKVYVTSGQDASFGTEVGESEFVCLDAYTGNRFWNLSIEAFAPRESVAVAYGKLFVIPSNITTAIDSFSGSEYDVVGQVWAFGGNETQTGDGAWAMFRHDAERSSVGNNGPSNLTLAWGYRTNGSVMSSPSVVNGVVYAGSQDMNVYAVDAWNGELVWRYQTNGTIESSPAVADGKVFIGSDDGNVYCLDSYSGDLIWKRFVNGGLPLNHGSVVMLRSSPAVVGDTVYVGSVDGNLYALDADNGEIVWKYETGGIITSSPTVADGFVYVTSEESTEGALYKVDADDGGLVWRKALEYVVPFTGGTDMQGTATVADGVVFVSTNLREYYAVNASSGETLWNYTNPAAIEFIVSSPIYVDGRVFIVDKFDIACLNASTGDKLWSSYSGDELYVSPSYADEKIYVVTSQRRIFVLNATNGDIITHVTTPSASWSSPTLVDGRMYVGNNDWNIYCFTDYISPGDSSSGQGVSPDVAYWVAVVAILIVMGVVFFYTRPTEQKKDNATIFSGNYDFLVYQ